MPAAADTLIGLVAAVASGVTGSAFTVPTRKEPELGWLAVRGWDWERTWLVFNLWNVVVNVVRCRNPHLKNLAPRGLTC